MTKDKIQLFRDMYLKEVKHAIDPDRKATRGEYIRIVLDGGIEFNTQTDFVIFDDDNEFLHIICANDDPYSQFDWPFKIMSAPYSIIFVIESIMSKSSLDDILNDSFLGDVINDEKKKFIRTWMDSSNNLHKPYPMDADPYYTQNPQSIPQGTKIIKRDDDIKIASSPATKAIKSVKAVKDSTSFIDAIANAEPGAAVALAADIELTETIKLEKPITIVGGGKTLKSSAPKAIEVYADATIKNITINNSSPNGRCVDTRKAVNLELDGVELINTSTSNNQVITIGGSDDGTNVTIRNSEISSGVAGYGLICFVGSRICIENCNFTGYNAIYMKSGSENSIICIINSILEGINNHPGEENRFATVVFEADNVSFTADSTSHIISTTTNDAYHLAFLVQPNLNDIAIIASGGVKGNPILLNEADSVNNNLIILPKKCEEYVRNEGFDTKPAKPDNIYKNCIRVVDYVEVTINGEGYKTLSSAIAAAISGDTIKLVADVKLEESLTVPFGKAITLDLAGHTINQTTECVKSYSMINNNGDLTITGNGKISFKDTSAGDPNAVWGSYTIFNRGTLNVENSTIENLSEQNVTGQPFAHTTFAISQSSGSTTINGGTISNPNYRSIRLMSGDMTINRGEFDGQVWVQAANDGVKMTINGGRFSPNWNDASSVFVENDIYNVEFAITDGAFEGKIGCSNAEALNGPITGGTFSAKAKESTNETLLANSFVFVENKDGTYAVAEKIKNYVAQIGDNKYESLHEAIDAATGDAIITTLSNIDLTDKITIPTGKAITLDLNGKIISQTKACTESYSMIENNGKLTITGNGKINFTDTSDGDPNAAYGSYTLTNYGTLIVENGTIENLSTQNVTDQPFAHTTFAIHQYSGSTTINDGTISNPNYRSARLWKGDMTINGGIFDGQVWVQAVDDSAKLIINGGSFSPNWNDASSVFVDNGSHSVSFEIADGYFEGKIGCSDAEALNGTITGGTFTNTAKTNTNIVLLAENYAFVEDVDDCYTVSKVENIVSD